MDMASVGVAELRQHLQRYLRLVERGERLVVSSGGRPVAELSPPSTVGAALDRLVLAGRVSRPVRHGLPAPVELRRGDAALSVALHEIRGER